MDQESRQPIRYADFDLSIEKGPEQGYLVKRLPSPSGEGAVKFAPPFTSAELERLLSSYRDIIKEPDQPPEKSSKEIGGELFSALFNGEIRSLWTRSLSDHQNFLRIRLHLTAVPEFETWPWELLYDLDRGVFLALSESTPIVRYPAVGSSAHPLKVHAPVKMLVVAASPQERSPLDVQQEWEGLKKALDHLIAKKRLILERVDSVTPGTLEEKLRQTWHILHFIGHGGFSGNQGTLVLEGEDREPVLLTGNGLGVKLLQQRDIRLVVLNSCEGALISASDPFSGVAQALIKCGVSAVVAMRCRIRDKLAIAWVAAFYSALSAGYPVEAALSKARWQVDPNGNGIEWSIPVLYMRSPDGQLFDIPTPSPPEPLSKEKWPLWTWSWSYSAPRWIGIWWIWAALGLLSVPLGLAIYRSSTEGPPVVASDPGCPSPPGLDMPFARISKGSFSMGKARDKEARPEHPVRITKPYCIGKFEVTQRQWKKVMGDNPSRHQNDDRPVEGVSWEDVQRFLAELNRKDPSGRYRLPTEAEWEFAAFSGGGSLKPVALRRYGNCLGWLDFYRKTAPVGTYRPNALGTFDLYGNVAEWVSDWYGTYSSQPQTDPTGPPMGTEKVRRGGFFGNSAENCSASYRASAEPDRRAEDTGFRVVRDSTSEEVGSNQEEPPINWPPER